jgi:hypothetical protein
VEEVEDGEEYMKCHGEDTTNSEGERYEGIAQRINENLQWPRSNHLRFPRVRIYRPNRAPHSHLVRRARSWFDV